MKTIMNTLVVLAALMVPLSGTMAQVKTETQKKEEQAGKSEKTYVIDSRKLSEEEFKKEMEDLMRDQYIDLRKLREEQFQMQKEVGESYKKAAEEMRKHGQHYISVVPPDGRNREWNLYYGDIWNPEGSSSLNISKNLDNLTHSTDFAYQVKEGNLSIGFTAKGSLTGGEMKILMRKPDGKVFQEINISPLADVNWNQQFRWKTEEQAEFLGTWTIIIKAEKASGNYSLRVTSK
ncbi:MAG: hypothetical protein R6V75_06140 [Bacteroidales bacterium]